MNIVPFGVEYYEECWLMGLEFFETTKYTAQSPDKSSVYSMFDLCTKHGISFVALDEYGSPVGMLLAVKDGLWLNNNVLVSHEVMWWVDEEYRNTSAGLRLIQAYESSCVACGITYIGMSLLCTSEARLADWLLRKGYKQMETAFCKEIS